MMNRRSKLLTFAFALWLGLAAGMVAHAEPGAPVSRELRIAAEPLVPLDEGWKNPPPMARTQCWWWWLNGNVTKEAITADLEAMKAQGLGGANIVDAGGANQRGHRQVPHGPDFGTTEWRDLFVHALAEADRLGLELGFNIQSGWNLGGPTVRPRDAAKKLTWAETFVTGGEFVDVPLPQPSSIADFYRDVAVLAIPLTRAGADQPPLQVSADSAQGDYPADLAIDGDENTFWVSGSDEPGRGPSVERPVLLKMEFAAPVTASEMVIVPREDYGPKRGWIQAADNPRSWRILTRWTAEPNGNAVIRFPRTSARMFRLVIVEAHDPRSPLLPRNVQIAEVELRDGKRVIAPQRVQLARIENFRQKMYDEYPGAFTAANAEHLLEIGRSPPGEEAIRSDEVVDLTERVDRNGRLLWNAPAGNWKILRLGYTLSGSRVSTSSEGWSGWAIDYLDPQAFEQYWQDVVNPLLEAARPYVGRSLKFLHTDSWELGPVNWTPALPEKFARRRGYEPSKYYAALAGYVVDDRSTSNRFLNDFRRTLADLIADGKYASFRRHAHGLGIGIHPESGGPHAAPIDALKCLGLNDVAMGEFWARSATHRVRDEERLFTKQAASAAHIYGRRVVLAESFTSIGPQWEEDPRSLKPVFDQAACEGLNLVMLHTYDCSPDELGEPGQAYFAGSHINRHVTWWHRAGAFFEYLNRCQFLLQQGVPVSDVLYFYGENVPSFVRLKADDPAHVVPGFDYDVINAEALIERTTVRDGQIVLPEGTAYQVLVLPEGGSYGLAALEHIASLADAGAVVVGAKPLQAIGLLDEEDAARFGRTADRLWGHATREATMIRQESARGALRRAAIQPDFLATSSGDDVPAIDYFHRRTTDADVYFVANRLDRWQDADCSFRITGRQPELWDPVSGEVRDARVFQQSSARTSLPLRFSPHGSMFVVFRRTISSPPAPGAAEFNEPRPAAVQELTGPWTVRFESEKGGPADAVSFDQLVSWSTREEPAIRYYSGSATYELRFDLPADPLAANQSERPDSRRWWLDLGSIKNVAAVTLNGSELGVAWTEPFRVELTGHLRPAGNELAIEVTNLWPNRLIGDRQSPRRERQTWTNITKFQAETPLLDSGLLGPVRLMTAEH